MDTPRDTVRQLAGNLERMTYLARLAMDAIDAGRIADDDDMAETYRSAIAEAQAVIDATPRD